MKILLSKGPVFRSGSSRLGKNAKFPQKGNRTDPSTASTRHPFFHLKSVPNISVSIFSFSSTFIESNYSTAPEQMFAAVRDEVFSFIKSLGKKGDGDPEDSTYTNHHFPIDQLRHEAAMANAFYKMGFKVGSKKAPSWPDRYAEIFVGSKAD